MRFWNFKNVSDDEVELRIDGDIVDDEYVWLYEWFGLSHTAPNEFRDALSQHQGKNLTVWIDSLGGSVWAAAGIYNALKEHDGRVTVKIDGKALSAGSVIAMAGDEVLISPIGTMMIHNPWMQATGDAEELRHVAEELDETKESIINAYQLKTGLSRERIAQLMDEETWMSAQKAVDLGFADGILYTEADKEKAEARITPSFAFSRMAVLNKADASARRFFDVAKQMQREADKPALALELELIKIKGDELDELDD